MSTRAPLLQIEGLKKSYGPSRVLDDVTLNIERGDFTAILGLSGAGKSTFLRCLNRLIEPSGGRILAPGKLFLGPDAPEQVDIARLSERELRLWRRKVGMIFQQFNLVRRLTVLDNVLSGGLGYQPVFWSSMRRFSNEDRERAMRNLDRVGLLEHAYKRADTLSGGQQQRVAIARALMQQPTVILADEPVASLDPKLSAQILDILKRVAREDGIAVLVSLHVLELARTYADRVIGFQGGRVIFDGTPEQLDAAAVDRVYEREDTPVGV
ncbi:MAG TPA: phosphonate ABC transporter ATP-binding protein [Oscillatoriaceae cyanobacterium]